MTENTYHVVSLSGGKDSTAMLLMMLERDMPIDDVIFFDTGWEFPEMYDHLKKVEDYTGIKITRLKSDKSFDYWMTEHEITRGKNKGVRGYGWASPLSRWCTSIKTRAIDSFATEHAQGREVVQYIGIAADEKKRIKDKRYPLVEWGVTEADALAYCKARGFDWGGLYDVFKRVSCFCCPLQSLNDLRNLRHYYPDMWKRMFEMDAHQMFTFRTNCTLCELEQRFAREDKQMSLFGECNLTNESN